MTEEERRRTAEDILRAERERPLGAIGVSFL